MKSRCVPELQEMFQAPKHIVFQFWYYNCLFRQHDPGETEESALDLNELEMRFRWAKSE